MAEDFSNRLEEARKHFVSKSYDACLKALALCPQDDPRVIHNTIICKYAQAPGNYRAVLAKLDLPPLQRVKSLKGNGTQPHLVLSYEGQELAYVSAAVLQLHNGSIAEARAILTALATLGPNFTPFVRARIAMLLHIAMRRSPSTDVSDTIGALMSDAQSTATSDPVLSRMLNLAFSDTSMLHGWFASSTRPNAERGLYLNNLGVEAFADGKAAVASVFFARAAKALSEPDADACPTVISSVAYNAAVCALARGSTNGVLASLLKAHSTMCGSILLWVRLAQVLIVKYQEGANEEVMTEYNANIINFASAALKSRASRSVAPVPPHQYPVSKKGGKLLTAAAMCLHTALDLALEKDRIVDAAKRLCSAPETAHLLDSILTMLAYVELGRGNFGVVTAIATDYSILERDVPGATTPRSQAIMTCYNVEALSLANRSSQALRILQSMDLGTLVARCAPNATIEALMTNLCVAFIMNGQWIKAIALAQQLTSKLASPFSQLINIYLDLAQGNRQAANDAIEAMPQQFVKIGKI